MCVWVCVSHCCSCAPSSSLFWLVRSWQTARSFLREGRDYPMSDLHTWKVHFLLAVKQITVTISLKKHYKTQTLRHFSASTCEGGWSKRRVSVYWEKTAAQSHTLHLEKWFTSYPDSELLLLPVAKGPKEDFRGRMWVSIWEYCSTTVEGMFCIFRAWQAGQLSSQ